MEKQKSTLLKHTQTATDIPVDTAHLEQIDSEVKIIHGTERSSSKYRKFKEDL